MQGSLRMPHLSHDMIAVLAESLSAVPVANRRAAFEPLSRFHGVTADEMDDEFEAVMRAIAPPQRCVRLDALVFNTDAICMHRLLCSAQARLCTSSRMLF